MVSVAGQGLGPLQVLGLRDKEEEEGRELRERRGRVA